MYFNTCTIWSPTGKRLGVHRKVHLFDIDVPGKIRFKESEVLSPGNEITIVETEFGKVGVGICYDIRFPEMAMVAARKGCGVMLYPGAFNMTTGPLHVSPFFGSLCCSFATCLFLSLSVSVAFLQNFLMDSWGLVFCFIHY
jgi:predicted amidohydrolase